METKYEDNAKIFKAFCDPNRLKILEILQNGEQCACNLLDTLEIGQPTLSHHMKILCESGIVENRRDAKWVYYRLSRKGVDYTKRLLEDILFLTDEAKNKICACDESVVNDMTGADER